MVRYLPLVAVFAPLVGVAVVALAHRVSDALGDVVVVAVSAITLAATAALYPTIVAGRTVSLAIETGFPVKLSFYVDALGFAFGLAAAFLWFLASLYSVTYMRHEHHRTRYNAFSLLSLAGMMGIVSTGNLFTLYIFFEMMAILSYVMVIHEETPEALAAGLKYLFMGIIGGLAVLAAIVATYVIAGSVDITGTGLTALAKSPAAGWVFWAYIFGFGVKAGMFPVHVWLPDAHPVAPSPASALLSGVMIKAGAYGIIRTVFAIFGREAVAHAGWAGVLMVLAIVTMMLGSAVAITQTEVKRLLAYSSIAQIGYIVLGVSMLTSQGLTGSVIHTMNHALMKGSLFMAAGSVILMTGIRELKDFTGLGKRMPVTMACFTIVALSMIGFPPFAGFISKWTLALGALEGPRTGVFGMGTAIAAIGALLLSSLLNVVYYGPIIIRAWFGEAEHEREGPESAAPATSADPPWPMSLPIVLMASLTVVFGVFPQFVRGLAELVARKYM